MILGRCGHTVFVAAAVPLLRAESDQLPQTDAQCAQECVRFPGSNTVKPQRQLRAAKGHCRGFDVPVVATGLV